MLNQHQRARLYVQLGIKIIMMPSIPFAVHVFENLNTVKSFINAPSLIFVQGTFYHSVSG